MEHKKLPVFRYVRKAVYVCVVVVPLLGIVLVIALSSMYAGKSIYELLGENKKLKQAITNLTDESQIGFAKVVKQDMRGGRLFTRLIFVETDRNDPTQRILEREYEIEGDIIYFDALIVKFSEKYVMDGRGRALYLWRRVYGERMPPEEGFPIESFGKEPQRYADICAALSIRDRTLFWKEIWNLSDDPERLSRLGIQAIYGNVVYKKVKPGLIYMFKISNTGTLYPETVPDI